ncbi:MAG TPA: tol-pal system protein YbgF [Methylocystis sp.]|nr:tol-pal system protein YbgF [Methylocystis sp.]
MLPSSAPRVALTLLLALSAAAEERAFAQSYNRTPYDNRAPYDDTYDDRLEPPPRHETGGVELRVERLERELRQMTGHIEELQHAVQQLEEQLRSARQEAVRATAPAPAGASRGDAFDPAGSPSAVGAPRPIGQVTPSVPLSAPTRVAATTPAGRDLGAPLDVTPPGLKTGGSAAIGGAPSPAAEPAPPPAQPSMKDEYDEAVALMRNGQYEAAEKSLSVFLAKYSKSKYAPAATYGLGESFFQRGRNREAAEKYLEITTKYPQSAQAPDALLRLGEALAALGAHEQACASFSEVTVKYPGSPARIRDAAQRESKKQQCG